MPEPVTMGFCSLGLAHFSGLTDWIEKHLPRLPDDRTETQIREDLGAYLQSFGWELSRSPFLKLTSVIPLQHDVVMQVLDDPRFEGCESLKGWVKQKLAQILTMSVEPGMQMADNCALFVVGQSEDRVESTFGLFWARIVDVDKGTAVNTFQWDTAEQVRDRLATKLSVKNHTAYKAVLDEICDNGVDGRFLSEDDLPLEELESFTQLSGLQAKVLRNHLARYKATSKEAVPRVAICIVASTVTLEFNTIPEYLFKNRVLGRVCQEKIMTYLKMRMAAEKPHELLDMHPGSSCTTVASEAEPVLAIKN